MSTIIETNRRNRRPPQVSGAKPLFGHLFEFRRNPVAVFRRGAKEHGPLFVVRLGPKRLYVMVGPDMNTEFFSQSEKVLSVRKPYRFLTKMFNDRVSLAAPEADYKHQRSHLAPLLGGKHMASHFEAMVKEMQIWLAQLGTDGRVDLITEFERLTMSSFSRAMLGDSFRGEMRDEFHTLFRDLTLGVDLYLPSNLPLPKFIRRDRAKTRLHQIVDPIVDARRAAPAGTYSDFFQDIVQLPDTDGMPMKTPMTTDIIAWLIFSGYTSMSSHFSWALIQLLQHPAWLAKVRDGMPAQVTLDSIRDFDAMNWAIKETERMSTPTIAIPRVTNRDYTVNGYLIPQGALVLLSPSAGHYLPEVFTEPERYDPERFSPDRAEDRRVKNALVGFGGGQHKCWGASFAYVQMAVGLTLLLQNYDLELQTVKPRMIYTQMPRPQRPTWVKYRVRERLAVVRQG